MTLIELLFASAMFSVLMLMVWLFFRSGQRNLRSTENKLNAIRRTHIRFESLRHDLEQSPWAWAAPEGGHVLVAGETEYFFSPETSRLHVGGKQVPGKYQDVRFFGEDRSRVKFLLTCNRASQPRTGSPGFRERSTLVTKVFLEAQAENLRERHHVWEEGHHWCVGGASIHYGFTD
jgi:hypothetical protein